MLTHLDHRPAVSWHSWPQSLRLSTSSRLGTRRRRGRHGVNFAVFLSAQLPIGPASTFEPLSFTSSSPFLPGLFGVGLLSRSVHPGVSISSFNFHTREPVPLVGSARDVRDRRRNGPAGVSVQRRAVTSCQGRETQRPFRLHQGSTSRETDQCVCLRSVPMRSLPSQKSVKRLYPEKQGECKLTNAAERAASVLRANSAKNWIDPVLVAALRRPSSWEKYLAI